MKELESASALAVRQTKEWAEILVDFESRNRYSVQDPAGRQLYWAAEESSLFWRLLLHTLRPFVMRVFSLAGEPVLRIVKPFRFYFHEAAVYTEAGALLGSVKREFTLVRKRFTVTDPGGAVLYDINAPILHPWTFGISRNGAECGQIVKRWSGLAKESFTDADNFSVVFPPEAGGAHKALLLGALFLIDMVYFEK